MFADEKNDALLQHLHLSAIISSPFSSGERGQVYMAQPGRQQHHLISAVCMLYVGKNVCVEMMAARYKRITFAGAAWRRLPAT